MQSSVRGSRPSFHLTAFLIDHESPLAATRSKVTISMFIEPQGRAHQILQPPLWNCETYTSSVSPSLSVIVIIFISFPINLSFMQLFAGEFPDPDFFFCAYACDSTTVLK